jgi:colanic acid/amylovoran biosynthesis glycosyltransferase
MIHYITQIGIGNAWVGNELARVDAAGVPFVLHAMRKPDGVFHKSPWAARLNERTRAMYPLPALAFALSVLLAPFLFGPRWVGALGNALFGRREHLRARAAGLWHFLVACHLARTLRHEPVSHLHAQWISSSGTIAMFAAWLLGKRFSFTGHAVDLFRDRCALLDKIERADFIVCISQFHRQFFLEHGARPEQCVIVYCGIDPEWFYPPSSVQTAAIRPYRILSSGRLVEKKGFAILIDACKQLADRGEEFECVIGGNGPLQAELQARIERLGLQKCVRLTGQALVQEEIVEFMHAGDVYVLPCVWSADGDVDGLPQMLMEAMACGLPAISTRLVGIPDLVQPHRTGLLVEPGDASGLADAMLDLKHDGPARARLADAGRQWVLERFDLRNCLEPLIQRYRERLTTPATKAPA